MTPIDLLYKYIIRPFLFQFDPETIHEYALEKIEQTRFVKPLIKNLLTKSDPRLRREIWGLTFDNPVGLAGGFDKNGICAGLWDAFGFSFYEIGTVTPLTQAGNPKPRLFRYPDRKALVNRMGFNNHGAIRIAQRLDRIKDRLEDSTAVIGISLGKQKETPPEDLERTAGDYLTVLDTLHPYGDFFVVNVSSPNTENLRSLQQADQLKPLLSPLLETLDKRGGGKENGGRKPLLVKLAPDLSNEEIEEAVDVICELGVDGVIATNTTNQTGEDESGGLSGQPLRKRSTEVIRRIAQQTKGQLPIIGCGGVFTAEDAIEHIKAGAWLVQVYTGFVYEGPTIANKINQGLIHYLNEEKLERFI